MRKHKGQRGAHHLYLLAVVRRRFWLDERFKRVRLLQLRHQKRVTRHYMQHRTFGTTFANHCERQGISCDGILHIIKVLSD